MSELAADGIPVAVTCRVLKLARAPYYRWLNKTATAAELKAAYRANALFDAHQEDPEFGHRFLRDQAAAAGEVMSERTAWKLCSMAGWFSTTCKKSGSGKKAGPPVHDDLTVTTGKHGEPRHDFTTATTGINQLKGRRHHRALDERGEAVHVRIQGRSLPQNRRLLHRRSDDGLTGR